MAAPTGQTHDCTRPQSQHANLALDAGAPSTHDAGAPSTHDPGRVKTQKGRLRRGIAFYRRCAFRVVLLPVARTSRWRGRSFYAFLTLRRFRTAKTHSGPRHVASGGMSLPPCRV